MQLQSAVVNSATKFSNIMFINFRVITYVHVQKKIVSCSNCTVYPKCTRKPCVKSPARSHPIFSAISCLVRSRRASTRSTNRGTNWCEWPRPAVWWVHTCMPQVELIGSGTFGTVYKAFDMLSKQYVAIKLIGTSIACAVSTYHQLVSSQNEAPRYRSRWMEVVCVHMSPQVTKYVQREVSNHRRLLHAHIVQLLEVRIVVVAPCTRTHPQRCFLPPPTWGSSWSTAQAAICLNT